LELGGAAGVASVLGNTTDARGISDLALAVDAELGRRAWLRPSVGDLMRIRRVVINWFAVDREGEGAALRATT